MLITRRTVLSGTAALAAFPALPAQARKAIALPQDIVDRDAATITGVRTRRPVVAMTFDDGPHPKLTPYLLDILGARGIKATFYLIGNRVVRYPELTRRISDEGHEIGNHSWSHPFMNRLGATSVTREIDRTTNAIFDVTGRPPVTFRPPYGAFSHAQRRALHGARNLPTILWSVDPVDWRRPGASVVARRIVSQAQPGSIILSHDIHPGTVRAMPAALDGMAQNGLGFVTVSEILGWPVWQSRRFRRAAPS